MLLAVTNSQKKQTTAMVNTVQHSLDKTSKNIVHCTDAIYINFTIQF